MSKRKYTHIKAMEPQIILMRKVGMTRQGKADELGLSKAQIKDWVKRYLGKHLPYRRCFFKLKRLYILHKILVKSLAKATAENFSKNKIKKPECAIDNPELVV